MAGGLRLTEPVDAKADLCASCTDLGITADKFLSINGSNGTGSAGNPGNSRSSGLGMRKVGVLEDIYSRVESCSFCRLVFKATYLQTGTHIRADGLTFDGKRVLCKMDWQLDGRTCSDNDLMWENHQDQKILSQALTRRLRLYNDENAFPETYLVLISESSVGNLSSPTFLGRQIDRSQADVSRMRKWIETCEDHHGPLCESLYDPYAWFPPTGSEGSLRFIDLEQMCLVVATSKVKYVTLSYTWGQAQTRLWKENMEKLYETGAYAAILHTLPRTIQHSMELVRRLGYRYLWVDALCILQDDTRDKEILIGMMDRIYGNSVLTICAAGGDSNFGLPGALPNSRDITQQVATCGNLKLLAVRRVESYIQHSQWNTRAWTFQERLLSTRCLIFVDDRVFFQCRQAAWSEEIDGESTSLGWTLDMIGSPLTVFKENPLRRYCTCVKLYSGRLLSFYTDKLNAFKGLGKVLGSHLDATLIYGLPDAFFDWALLWEVNESSRREEIQSTFPSWSWCGWGSGVEWRLSTTSGALINLHQWLTNRTWIVWYRGTSSSHELVWGPDSGPRQPTRWDGYSNYESSDPYHQYGRSAVSGIVLHVSELPRTPTLPPRQSCLHFWTYSAYFSLSRKNMSTAIFKTQLNPGLQRFSLHDSRGDWCGTIILDEHSIMTHELSQSLSAFEFIAISEAKDFELDELDSWTYYIPQEREQAEWYLYYALLIRWNENKHFYERVGLAKIFKSAFHSGSLEPGGGWREIILG